ncbi:PREDICTED: pescadillo homolog isoform X2 [Erythranthe guttata]|uniref:pescadillo homolog isoform X2 n=1 Tax=Erythranthe guttata TaxID=4155 RepID=UPI00064D7448|nr:PREDICTED: pescadillo homolog isoform X2 [Erythranthe guttata]|eukprot:XP_012833829.1 PREDICTED: pescadillo homolog isoform X2 [Erythranthe guttata]
MPKHYRPAGKKKEGNAAKYVTRTQAVKYLQISLPVFRKLCILKGVFPRVPKKKVKGNHHSYYHMKDIMFLKHEPLLEKLRDIRTYDKKIKKAVSKKNRDLAERLLTRKPSYTLDMLVRERYPKFIDALRDLDDCLSMVHLFAALPAVDRAVDGEKIPVERVHNCRRLSHEWLAYISRTHKLRKTFISVKGIYYQAEVEGQIVTWLTPHALQQVLPEVDYRVLLTFLEFYETLLAFVNYKLYRSINVNYPPILDPRLEALAADLYALSRYFDANGKSKQIENQQEGTNLDESEVRLAQLHQHLPSNEPGALMHLLDDGSNKDDQDLETRECKSLFKNVKFFLSREVPRESLLFVIPAFGGTVSWEGEGAPFDESDDSITHQVVDRPIQGRKFLSREYVQPQWVYDCVNARILLPTDKYMVGCIPPPHLSPFVDNEAEGHVPDYAEAIERMKAAGRKEVLPLPGTGIEDLDDPQGLLVSDRQEAIEAAKRKQQISMLEKQYLDELKLELKGAPPFSQDIDAVGGGDDAISDVQQIADDVSNMSKVVMPRKKRKLLEAMEVRMFIIFLFFIYVKYYSSSL